METLDNDKQTTKNVYIIPLSILIAGASIAGAVVYSNISAQSSNTKNIAQQQLPAKKVGPSVNIKDVNIKNEPFIGKADAPVTLAYWFDFQCPYCKQFDLNNLPILINKYVKNGKLKIVFKDFQFLGSDSQTAGIAEKAIWELYPDKYFKWYKAMLNKQDGENSGFGNKSDIINLIKTIPGMDANKISKLMDKNKVKYQEELDADKAEGAKFGINGTPGFVIGTQSISGAQPVSVFEQIIDSELKNTK